MTYEELRRHVAAAPTVPLQDDTLHTLLARLPARCRPAPALPGKPPTSGAHIVASLFAEVRDEYARSMQETTGTTNPINCNVNSRHIGA